MKVSITWLGVFIVFTAIVYFTWKGFCVYEAFQTSVKKEGFVGSLTDDIIVTTCPTPSSSYINSQGQTMCCDGTLVNGGCSGTTICSLSEKTSGIPTCGAYVAAVLDQKGSTRCPPSMPNYYENADGSVKGCTSGRRSPDGTGPASANSGTSCTLYSQEIDDIEKLDSCTNKKLLETSKCFSRNIDGVTSQLISNKGNPALIQCTYKTTPSSPPETCITDSSLERYMDYLQVKGWRETTATWDPLQKLQFCSVAQRYAIDKTLTFQDLPKASVYS
jgi:hypothetical protein